MVFLNWKILKVVLLDFSVLFWPNNCTWQTKVQKKKTKKRDKRVFKFWPVLQTFNSTLSSWMNLENLTSILV